MRIVRQVEFDSVISNNGIRAEVLLQTIPQPEVGVGAIRVFVDADHPGLSTWRVGEKLYLLEIVDEKLAIRFEALTNDPFGP